MTPTPGPNDWLLAFLKNNDFGHLNRWAPRRQIGEAQAIVVIAVAGELEVECELWSESDHFQAIVPLFELRRGDIFVVPPARPTAQYWFKASPDNLVLSLPLEVFTDHLLRDPTARSFDAPIEKWGTRLLGLLADAPPDAGDVTRLAPRAPIELGANTRVSANTGTVVWLPSAHFSVDGVDAGANTLEGNWWPVPENMSAVSRHDVSCKTDRARRLFRGPEGASMLVQLAGHLLDQLTGRRRASIADNEELVRARAELRRLHVQSATGRLVRLLDPKQHRTPDSEDPLIIASFELIHRLGWAPAVPKSLDTSDPDRFVQRIADASDLGMRHAKLKPDWWHHDHGSFLGFGPEGEPLVLLRKRSGYLCWDPRTGTSAKVTAGNADRISEEVIYFHRNFDRKKLTLRDLVFFEWHSVKPESFALVALSLIGALIAVVVPMITGFIINSVLPAGQSPLLWVFVGALVAIGIFQVGFVCLQQIITKRMNARLDLASTAALWDRVLNLPAPVLARFGAGDLSSRMSSLTGIQMFFRNALQTGGYNLAQVVSSIALMMWLNFELAVIGVATASIGFLASIGFSIWQKQAFSGGEKSTGMVNSFVLELFSGIHKIRGAAAEVSAFSHWATLYARLKGKSMAAQRISNYYSGFNAVWGALNLAVMYFIVAEIQKEPIEIGYFIAFLSAYANVTMSLSVLASLMLALSMQLVSLKFIAPLLDNVPEAKTGKAQPTLVEGRLELDGVTFSYPGQPSPALSNVSLAINAGEFVAVVGMSGSGKSSLAKMIAGLDKPTRGRVFLGDFDLQSLDRHVMRENIGVVQQDFRLLPGTLFENIQGATQCSIEDTWEAARIACIDTDIRELPMGMHTMVSGDAQVFSGGQIQRLAIARVLVHKPKVMVFDEATSALDNRVQGRIMKNLAAINATTVFIAHRLNLVKSADRIIVLDKGGITERGTWDELVQGGGLFAKMAQASLVTAAT